MPKPGISPIDVCCEVAKQFDIPEVEAVRLQVEAIGTLVWEQMLQQVAEEVGQAQRDEQGPEWILLLLLLLDNALVSSVNIHQKDLLRAAAVRLGAQDRATTAVEDFLLLLRGKFQRNQDAVRDILSRRAGNPSQIRFELETLFGKPSSWMGAVSDLWAYRWHWAGDVLGGRTRGVTRFTYTNPLDSRTTPFCFWLVRSGRIVTVGKVMTQINELERAIVQNDIDIAIKAWPLLTFKGNETPADFNRMFTQNNLGAPPFHWRCRTRLIAL